MDTVYECLGVTALNGAYGFGHGAVSQQHKLLNQLVGIL